jgi:hypothetical protein
VLSSDQRYVLRSLVARADDPRGSALFALGYWAGWPMNNSRARTNAMEIFHNLDGAYEALESDTAISLPPIAALKP